MRNKEIVFISYKSEEYKQAAEMRAFLEENGIKCWMAPESIEGGASYAKAIPRAISKCPVFLLMLSKKAQLSVWIPKEVDQALSERKMVLPYVMEEFEQIDEMKYYLRNVQQYYAFQDKERKRQEILERIKEAFPEMKTEEKVPKPPKQKRDYRKLWMALGMVLALFLAVFIYNRTSSVTVCDQKVKRTATSIRLESKLINREALEPLTKLKNLTSYTFEGCIFSDDDYSGLFNRNTYGLYFLDSSITNIQFDSMNIEELEKLQELAITNNHEMSLLSGIEDVGDTLRSLDISGTSVSDMDFLENCPGLVTLNINDLELQDASALSNCKKLRSLRMSDNGITSLKSLSDCTELELLYVNNNQLTNLEGIEKCIYLTDLSAGGNKLTSLKGLENATLLETVYLNDNELEDLTVLEKSANTIKNLYFKNNKVSDGSFIAFMPNLEYLNADNNKLTLIAPLAGYCRCLNLRGLSVASNQLESLNVLNNNRNLEYLNVSNNQIQGEANIYGILQSALSESVIMDLSYNAVDELRLGFETYRYLDLRGTNLTSLEALSQAEIQELVFDYKEEIDFKKLGTYDVAAFVLVGCPLDKQVEVQEFLGKYKVTFVEEGEAVNSLEELTPFAVNGRGSM